MAWRVARSLDTLLSQINAAYPNRSKASDGSIGDAEHATRDSDHNPWYGPGIVTARDFTHDPAHGFDIDAFTDELVASRDRRIKYVIANGLILDSRAGNRPWQWVKYNGANQHNKHFHLSVMDNSTCDDVSAWNVKSLHNVAAPIPSTDPAPSTSTGPVLQKGVNGEATRALQRVLNAWYPFLKLTEDGVFGNATEAAVKELQRRAGLEMDGIVGPKTRAVLHL